MSWQDELRRAVVVNAGLVPVYLGPSVSGLGPRAAAELAARVWREHVPYRFEGDSHPIVDFRRCRRRGWGACADAVAWVAAAAKYAGGRDVGACYETHPSDPDYAHVSAIVEGLSLDPLPEYAYHVRGCSARINL